MPDAKHPTQKTKYQYTQKLAKNSEVMYTPIKAHSAWPNFVHTCIPLDIFVVFTKCCLHQTSRYADLPGQGLATISKVDIPNGEGFGDPSLCLLLLLLLLLLENVVKSDCLAKWECHVALLVWLMCFEISMPAYYQLQVLDPPPVAGLQSSHFPKNVVVRSVEPVLLLSSPGRDSMAVRAFLEVTHDPAKIQRHWRVPRGSRSDPVRGQPHYGGCQPD